MTLLVPELLQTKKYNAKRWRTLLSHAGGGIQAGVWDSFDFKVNQRAAGANMSVDVAGGSAIVAANDPGNSGYYHQTNDASVNVPLTTAAHATLPRIDQLVLTVNDSTDGSDPSDTPVLQWLVGTATAGATLDNRAGAVTTLPTATLRLADVLIPGGASTIPNANIRDRRSWARGAFSTATANLSMSIGYTQPTGCNQRLEMTGATVRITISFMLTMGTVNQALNWGPIGMTGGAGPGYVKSGAARVYRAHTTSETVNETELFFTTPGSFVYGMYGATTSGTATLDYCQLTIEEILRPSATNG